MQQTRLYRTLVLAFGAISLIAACASLGTEEDQSTAGVLRTEMEGYQQWAQFEGYPGIQKSKSKVHGKYVATYINAIAARNPTDLAFGSIIVKANYAKKDVSTLKSTTVMKRIEGYDPENGDWFWARYAADGELTHSGKVSMCLDCHFDADDDFVFLND